MRKRVKKSYSPPTDPQWDNQWSLVSYYSISLHLIFHTLHYFSLEHKRRYTTLCFTILLIFIVWSILGV